MVRARGRDHLEALKRQFPDLIGQFENREFAGMVYAFRIFVDKPVWSQVLAGLVEETDFDNFKSEVLRAVQNGGAGRPNLVALGG